VICDTEVTWHGGKVVMGGDTSQLLAIMQRGGWHQICIGFQGVRMASADWVWVAPNLYQFWGD